MNKKEITRYVKPKKGFDKKAHYEKMIEYHDFFSHKHWKKLFTGTDKYKHHSIYAHKHLKLRDFYRSKLHK